MHLSPEDRIKKDGQAKMKEETVPESEGVKAEEPSAGEGDAGVAAEEEGEEEDMDEDEVPYREEVGWKEITGFIVMWVLSIEKWPKLMSVPLSTRCARNTRSSRPVLADYRPPSPLLDLSNGSIRLKVSRDPSSSCSMIRRISCLYAVDLILPTVKTSFESDFRRRWRLPILLTLTLDASCNA